MNFFAFLTDHFAHAAPVLLAALIGLAIIVDRYKALVITYAMKDTKAFMRKIEELVAGGNTPRAIALCDEFPEKPVARVVRTALMRSHLPEEAIEQGVNITLSECTGAIQKRTSFLATIANVATLMGLFGTIMGLIQSFNAVAGADPAQKSALLSAGISTSMNATMLGLAVAIPAMVAYAFLVNRANHLIGETEEAALKTMDILKLRYFGNAVHNTQNTTSSVPSKVVA